MRLDQSPSTPRSQSEIRIDDIATHEILEGLARMHSLVVVSDVDSRVLWMSDALGSACGGAARHMGEQLCSAFAALPGAREKARIQEQLSHIQHHLRQNETLCDIRLDLGTHNGVARSVDLSAFRTETQSGDPIVVSIIHPSEQRSGASARDEALATELEDLADILDGSPDGVLALDRFGFVQYANSALAELLDVDPDKLVDSPIALLVPRSADLVALLSEGSPIDVESAPIEVERNDGRSVFISVRARQRSRNPRIRRIAFLRDVTAEVAARTALERQNAELEAYVHSVSHDLRSPLVSLLGFTRLLQQDYGHRLDETGHHFTDRIEQAAHTMRALIDDLLELSRIDVGEERHTLVDPRAVLLQLQAELKLRLEDAGVRLAIPESPPLLLCDRTRLYQVFSNLIGNALQHMGDCEDRTIRVEIRRDADHDVVVVSDSGQGIEPDEIDRIFDAFYSRSRSKGSGSTGMGLAIVRKIAETHGGRAWVESAPGRGARFHVSLPRKR